MNKLDKAFWLFWGIAVGILVYQAAVDKMQSIASREAWRVVGDHYQHVHEGDDGR